MTNTERKLSDDGYGCGWYEFLAWNEQSHFGFGSEAEADKFCDILNRKRRVNHYQSRLMFADEAGGLDSGDDDSGFRLDLAIDSHEELPDQDQ